MEVLLVIGQVLKRIPFIVYVGLFVMAIILYLYFNNEYLRDHLKLADAQVEESTKLIDDIKTTEIERAVVTKKIDSIIKMQVDKKNTDALSDTKVMELYKLKGGDITSKHINDELNSTLSCIEKITRDYKCE